MSLFLLMSVGVLCKFWRQIPYQISVLHTFPPHCACLFIILTKSFKEQKLLILMRSNLPVFLVRFILFVFSLRNLCLNLRSERFYINSMIHLELIFVCAAS